MDRYLTIPEAAELLRTTPKTISNKMSAGVFKEGVHYFRPPVGRPLFMRSALIEWVERPPAKEPTRIRMAGGYELGSGR